MSDLRLGDVTRDDAEVLRGIRTRSFGPVTSPAASWWDELGGDDLSAAGRFVGVRDGDGALVAAGRIHPFAQAWGGRHLAMGGIGGVYVDPAARGAGVASLLMRGILRRMVELGDTVSCLFPTTASLYRGVGYEVGGVRARYAFPAEHVRALGRAASGPRPRLATAADATLLQDLQRRYHEQHRVSGDVALPLDWWAQRLDDPSLATYVTDGGFVTFRLMEGVVRIARLAALTPEAGARLWGLAASGSSAAPRLTAVLDPRDPLRLVLGALPETTVEEEPWLVRVVDLPGAVAGRGFAPDLAVAARLDVVDPDVPECAGRWEVTVSGGRGSATRLDDVDEADSRCVRVGPRGLAAVWAGWTISRVRQAGLAEGGGPEDEAALDAVFAAEPYLTEYF